MITLADILAATNGALLPGSRATDCTGVSTDSRTITRGSLFIALRGERFDGHDFVAQACRVPQVCVLVERSWIRQQAGSLPPASAFIAVDDTLQALQQLAAFHRQRCSLPVIGVTGSNGKSTTKELIATVLGTRFRVYKSPGSFNNHIGVPLSVLSFTPEHEAAVLELGMNHAGEIRRLAQISRPQISVITNVAEAHAAAFDCLADIAAAKCEILEHMSAGDVAVVNVDVPELRAACRRFPVRFLTFGVHQPAMYMATDIRGTEDGVTFRVNRELSVRLPLLGKHNVTNALAAIAVGRQMGIADEMIQQALAGVKPLAMRLQTQQLNGRRIVLDCYNANPASVAAAVEVLMSDDPAAVRRILVLADMKELGAHSAAAHKRVGILAASRGVDMLVTVGDEAAGSAAAARAAGMDAAAIHCCATAAHAGQVLARHTRPGDRILLKGSRAMRLEEALRQLEADAAPASAPR